MLELRVDADALVALGRALKREANGKELRRDLLRELKRPLAPAVSEVKAGLMAIGHGGLPTAGEPLRAAAAKRIKPEAKLSGRAAGVRVRARKTPGTRNFALAARRLNRASGWRHRVYGRDVWVHQDGGDPGWFERPLEHRSAEFRAAVLKAMNDMAARIAANVGHG